MSALDDARDENRSELAEAGGVLDPVLAAYVAGQISPALLAAGWVPEQVGDIDGDGFALSFEHDGKLVVITIMAVGIVEQEAPEVRPPSDEDRAAFLDDQDELGRDQLDRERFEAER